MWVPPGPGLGELLGSSAIGVGAAIGRPLLVALTRAATRRSRPGPRPATPVAGPAPGAAPGDPGWFGPASVAWKVQADTSMFVAGIAAFALQLLHPLALAGVVDHSSFADDFLGRVQRTGEFVQGIVFGDSTEAERRAAGVRRIHRKVAGTAPDGRPYAAGDPDLLEWVHLGEYLAIAAAYRRFGAAPLSDAELDAYVDEVAVAGTAVGVEAPPRRWANLDAALQRHRPSLAVGEQTLAALEFLAAPPGLPAAARPAWRVAYAGAAVCMPPWARRLLRLADPPPAALVACRGLVRALGAVAGPPPPLVAARARLGLA
ncbi:MAG TPA: oxygenase MpaB family protein [Acidimicrobiales bacterium]|nr:oxygenase MpaB family protein [Acidimicrobiales bacterium]